MSVYRPARPGYNTALELYTFQDAVDHVMDSFEVNSIAGVAPRRAVRAVLESYRDLPNYHNWTYLSRRGQITTSASQSTGTIAYDHTGGAFERLVTLSDATFPAAARNYRIIIDSVHYDIEEYKSSTTVTLTEQSNPGADVAAGTTYQLYRSQYPLPPDYRRGTDLVDVGNGRWPLHCSPTVGLAMTAFSNSPQDSPLQYTIRNGGNEYSAMVVEFFPPPSTARTYDFQYRAAPRPLALFSDQSPQYSTGTISVSGTTVTGTSTAFSARMVGCVIRFTSSDSVPSGLVGSVDNYVPYDEQAVVQSVTNSTTLVIDHQLSGSYSDKPFSIGDPLDIDPGVMLTPLLYLAEANFERLSFRQREDQTSGRMARFYTKFREAMAADFRMEKVDSGINWSFAPNTHLAEVDYS